MSETRPEYKTGSQEVDDAMEMLGKGYDVPLEIHPPTTVIRRHGFGLTEEVVPAFIKISTAFKTELKEIDANALKVWIFLALSINRNTEEAHPGIRTIAEQCNLDKDTVSRAVKRLEAMGLLAVDREKKKYNIYKIPEYVSANTVPTMGTPKKSVPIDTKSVPIEGESVPTSWGLNQINQSNQNIKHTAKKRNFQKPDFINMTVGEAVRLPELRIFQEATGRIPGQGQWETVYNTIQGMNGNGTPEKLRPFYLEWCARGYNVSGLAWLTDWAVAGEIAGRTKTNPSGRTTKQQEQAAFFNRLKELSDKEDAINVN